MTASAVMNTEPTVLNSTDTIATATRYMMKNRFRSLPVVDHKGCFLGMFGVHRLLHLLLPEAVVMDKGLTSAPFACSSPEEMHDRLQGYNHEPVTRFLEPPPVVHPDSTLIDALLKVYNTDSSVPVVDRESNCLVGVISYWDIGENVLKASSHNE